MTSLSVSIVVFSESKVGIRESKLLSSILLYLESHRLCRDVFVFDNSPSPFFRPIVMSYKRSRYIHFDGINLGFGKAHNISRYLSACKYHLFLNPDIIFDSSGEGSDVLEVLASVLVNDSSISMVQPLLLSEDGSQVQYLCKQNPTLLSQVGRGFMGKLYVKLLSGYDDWYVMKDLAYGRNEVASSYLSGAFMLCRRSFLDDCDWFDPSFFMYLEDADLSRRLSALGKCLHVPSVSVRHVWRRGSHSSLRLRIIAISSYLNYARKWGVALW